MLQNVLISLKHIYEYNFSPIKSNIKKKKEKKKQVIKVPNPNLKNYLPPFNKNWKQKKKHFNMKKTKF